MNLGKDLVGEKFSKLTVLRLAYTKNKKRYWECACECGNASFVSRTNLVTGNTKSCGCMMGKNTKHGMRKSRPYTIWSSIISRCNNKNVSGYQKYGAKGISVCDKWLTFKGFWEDMKEGYSDDLSIDRKDNSKGYSKENCKWSTNYEQSRNKTNNIVITYNGKSMCLKDWAKLLGIKYTTLWMRIYSRGLSVEDAFTA